jgi:two-component system NtrC family sensor kinase
VTDVRMPRLDGLGLYDELRRRRPELARRVVFITGDTLDADTRRFLSTSGALLLVKPFELGRLLAAIHDLLTR